MPLLRSFAHVHRSWLAALLLLDSLSCRGGAQPGEVASPAGASSVVSSGSASAAALEPPASDGGAAPATSVAAPGEAPQGRVTIGKLFENPPSWDVRGMFGQHQAEFDACWAQVLKTKPNERGKLSIRFIVSAEGKVTKTEEVSSTFRDASLSACVQKVVAGLPWPPPGGTATVVLPLVFHP